MANSEENQKNKRALRRKRRRRARLIAILITNIVLLILLISILLGSKYIVRWLNDKKVVEQPVVEVVEEPAAEPVEVPEDFTPDNVEETEDEEPEVIEPEETYEEQLDKMIDEMIAQMPIEDRVAGLFVITPEALTGQDAVTRAGNATKKALEQYPVGGIIYFKANIASDDQVKEMIENTASYSKYPLFFAIDEEGGEVARIQSALGISKTPTAKELGKANDKQEVYNTYSKIGNYLSDYGFNVDFAPVADVLTNPDNYAIGSRSFSSESSVVAEMIPQAVAGIQDSGVAACLKHWPGQGGVDADTHKGLAKTSRTKAEMEELEFEPFKAGIDAGVQMIMAGHLVAPAVTGDTTPCSLSRAVINDILREELGYDGLVITDALNMGAISEYYGSGGAAVQAIKAGCDMVLMPENFKTAYDAVIAAVKDGTIPEETINTCLRRVYRIKYADALVKDEN